MRRTDSTHVGRDRRPHDPTENTMHSKWVFLALLLLSFLGAPNLAAAQTSSDWNVNSVVQGQSTTSYTGLHSSSITVTNNGPDCVIVTVKESGNAPPAHDYQIPADGQPHTIPVAGQGEIISVEIRICPGVDMSASGRITF